MRILFRADASLAISSGHVYRCLTLAAQLIQHGCEVHFISTLHPGHLSPLIENSPITLHTLPPPTAEARAEDTASWLGRSWQEDAELTLAIIEKLEPFDWLIIDHYSLDSKWENRLKASVKRLMVIDDLANRQHRCDLLLDQTYGRNEDDYDPWIPEHCELWLGADYTLLRDEFVQAKPKAMVKRNHHKNISSLLIGLGGTDAENATEQVLTFLESSSLPSSLQIMLIAGPNNPHITSLKRAVKNSRFDTHLFHAVSNMAELLIEADLAIGAAGGSAWERCVMALPSLTLVLADNQRKVAQQLDELGVSHNLGYLTQLTPQRLQQAIALCEANYQSMFKASQALIDGMGASRAALGLFTVNSAQQRRRYLKRASYYDCQQLFEWQQAPQTRRYALNPAKPNWSEHSVWFQAKQQDPDCYLFIVCESQQGLGMLRLDKVDHNSFEISIVTAPEHYRQGVARAALLLARKAFANADLHATVLTENIASRQLFLSQGYEPLDPTHLVQRSDYRHDE